jgi:hypothetical protein
VKVDTTQSVQTQPRDRENQIQQINTEKQIPQVHKTPLVLP